MIAIAAAVLAASIAFVGYAYIGYAGLLTLVSLRRPRRPRRPTRPPLAPSGVWPTVSISIPVHNEAATIEATLERLLAADYPPDRRQILVISDASTDGTDAIVRRFASRGVELLRLDARVGKTAAENASLPLLRGEIIVNTDASIHIAREALRPLIAAFAEPSVGVASGRDVSVARLRGGGGEGGEGGDSHNQGESGYVGYEMWLRDLETRTQGIVGASGCCYAIRAPLHRTVLPGELSRDFAAALIARERGLRAVSVPEAVCFVPRTGSLRSEFRRKVRTLTRGVRTLLYKRHLLDPARYGWFAWMLFSHKVCRWLVPWAGIFALASLAVLGGSLLWARWILALSGVVLLAAIAGWVWPRARVAPRFLALPAYLVSGNIAALVAVIRALRGSREAMWEPTRRETVPRHVT